MPRGYSPPEDEEEQRHGRPYRGDSPPPRDRERDRDDVGRPGGSFRDRDLDRGGPPGPGGGGRGPKPHVLREERTSLLVRNIPRDTRPEELRGAFERFGPIKDVYLPRDYYTGEPRGFGFVQFQNPVDAEDAAVEMDRSMFLGREVTVLFAEENRKKPEEMRTRESYGPGRGFGGGGYGGRMPRRRSPPYTSRGPYYSRGYHGSPSPSPSPPRERRRSRSPPPRPRRSPSPRFGPPGDEDAYYGGRSSTGRGERGGLGGRGQGRPPGYDDY